MICFDPICGGPEKKLGSYTSHPADLIRWIGRQKSSKKLDFPRKSSNFLEKARIFVKVVFLSYNDGIDREIGYRITDGGEKNAKSVWFDQKAGYK